MELQKMRAELHDAMLSRDAAAQEAAMQLTRQLGVLERRVDRLDGAVWTSIDQVQSDQPSTMGLSKPEVDWDPGVAPNPDLVRRLVFSRLWFHQIHLGDDIVTPGVDDSSAKLERLGLPVSLAGQSVIDVGAWDGVFSFEAERRGAKRVVSADYFCWTPPSGDGHGFDIARWALGSKVEKKLIKVEDLNPDAVGTFDLVLFLGVLYHAPDPPPLSAEHILNL